MKTVKHEEHYYCDKCGCEIKETVYELKCYAFAVGYENSNMQSVNSALQNIKQNMSEVKQLCSCCKDKLTDGIYIR